MRGYNRTIIMGNLGADVELRQTQSGTPVANFSVATSRKFRTKTGEERDETTWHKLVVWGACASACAKYLKKGSCVHVDGRLENRSWTGQDNQKRTSMQLVVEDIIFVGGPKSQQIENPEPSPADAAEQAAGDLPEPPDDNDLPF